MGGAARAWLVGCSLIVVIGGGVACRGIGGDGDDQGASADCRVFSAAEPDDCEVVGVAFEEPLVLADVEALAGAAGGEPVALWRQDAVCVADVSGARPSLPAEAGARRSSTFVYWRADEVAARQEDGPPPTDGGWSDALRSRFRAEWAAVDGETLFAGAALYVPVNAELGTEGFPVAAYRTDVDVLYLRDHEAGLADRLPSSPLSCSAAET